MWDFEARKNRAAPDNPKEQPRAKNGRAPDPFRVGGWVPMREYADHDEVDFAIVGTGAGGGTLAAKLSEAGFSVVAFDAGPFWRPLEDFASDEHEQTKLYWTDDRIVDGENPIQLGSNNSGKSVGGSTVHFAMVSLRFRPEWFKSRTTLGYGVDWPVDWREMWRYYKEVEHALCISGPVAYPWGPKRPAYPYRPHELNAAAELLARGAEIRDLAMVGKIEMAGDRVTGIHYLREDQWRFQKAKKVVVSGYAIETPRLLLMSANAKFPDGLSNSSGLVGKNLMV